MTAGTPSSRRPGLRRPHGRHALASLGAVLALAATIITGVAVAPSGAEPAPAPETSLVSTAPLDGTEISVAVAAAAADAGAASPAASGPSAEELRRALGLAVVEQGATRLGAPYVYSAGGPNAFDCSGFVRWAWLQLGVELPHNSVAMWNVVARISVDDLQPGDIVFDSVGGPPAHVGIYVGFGWMIHAPNSGGVVRYDRVGWWTGATVTAGRVQLPL